MASSLPECPDLRLEVLRVPSLRSTCGRRRQPLLAGVACRADPRTGIVLAHPAQPHEPVELHLRGTSTTTTAA